MKTQTIAKACAERSAGFAGVRLYSSNSSVVDVHTPEYKDILAIRQVLRVIAVLARPSRYSREKLLTKTPS